MKTSHVVLGGIAVGLAGFIGYEAFKYMGPRKQVAAQSYGALLTQAIVIDTNALPASARATMDELPAHAFLATLDEEPSDLGVAFAGILGPWLLANRTAGRRVFQRPEPFEEDALVFAIDDAPHDWLEVTF